MGRMFTMPRMTLRRAVSWKTKAKPISSTTSPVAWAMPMGPAKPGLVLVASPSAMPFHCSSKKLQIVSTDMGTALQMGSVAEPTLGLTSAILTPRGLCRRMLPTSRAAS